MKTHTHILKYLLYSGSALLLGFFFLSFFSSSFIWEETARQIFTENEKRDLAKLNEEFGISRAISLSRNELVGRTETLTMTANVLQDERLLLEKPRSEFLVETASGEVLLLESQRELDMKKVVDAYQELSSVSHVETNFRGKIFQEEGSTENIASFLFSSKKSDEISLRNIVVAVLDSGIDEYHVALKGALWNNPQEYKGLKGRDDDGNGYEDDLHGWNFFKNNGDLRDSLGHGTHVSGIIAAQKTGYTSMKGVYPEGAKIMMLKITDPFGSMRLSDVIAAVEYAKEEKADIINMSFGFSERSEIFDDILRRVKEEGILLVAAAGNSGSQNEEYPAGYEETFGVGAADFAGGKTDSSNYGSWVDVYVPGKLLSTLPNNEYGTKSGTSQSSALVSGIAASILGKNLHDISPDNLQKSVIDFGEQFDLPPELRPLKKFAYTQNWIRESADLLQQGKSLSEQDEVALGLQTNITRQDMDSFLVEFFQGRNETLLMLSQNSESTKTPMEISPNIFVNTLTGNLLSEDTELNGADQKLLTYHQAQFLLQKMRSKLPESEQKPLPFISNRKGNISRKEFLELFEKMFL
ncbi:S8 family serine peptidase [Candidatus Peregrinibacteria bacterium]|nr:S8 family serine peptidase [Candidatus Peregrinibacteria bacterium]